MKTLKSTFFQIIRRKESLLFLILIVTCLNIYGWVSGKIGLTSFPLNYKPISPIVAITFIILCILFLLNIILEKSRLTKSIVTIILICIALYYSTIFVGYFYDFTQDFENIFIINLNRYGTDLTGYMSPIASVLYIFICLSALSVRQNKSGIIKNIGGSFAVLACFLSSVLIIGYLYNAPLLYGSNIIPVALPAAICFLLFNITLLRLFEFEFWTNKLIQANKVTRQLLKTFLPVVVFIVILQGFLTTWVPLYQNNQTLSVALVLFIVIAITIGVVFRVSAILGNKIDIAEKTIKDNEQTLKFYTNNSPMAVVEWDSEFVVTRWTGDSEKIFGWKSKEVIGKKIMDLNMIFESEIPIVQKTMEKLISKINSYVISTNRNYRKDGSIIICEWYNTILTDENGKMLSVLSQVLDITARKLAEEALHLEKENFRHSLDDSPLGVRIATKEGNTIYANKTLLDLYGYDSLGELQKVSLKDRYTQESYLQAQKRKHKRELGDLSDTEYEVNIIRKDGNILHLKVFRKEVLWDGILQFQIIYEDITERVNAENEIVKMKESLGKLNRHLDEIRENERGRISREIHDQLGQSLTALKIDLYWIYGHIARDSEDSAKVEGMIELLTGTIKDVQRISAELRPPILDDLGLIAAMEWYCEEFAKRTGLQVHMEFDNLQAEDMKKNLAIFRILQESVTNIIRHANAKKVQIELYKIKKDIILVIQDDGIGISQNKINSSGSFGILGMYERARQFGGHIEITIPDKGGTNVKLCMPI